MTFFRMLATGLIGAAAMAPAAAVAQQALTYDAQTRTPVPIPPGERGVQTVTAVPWLELPGVRDLEGPAFERDGNLLFSDVARRRVLRVTPDKRVSTVVTLEGMGPGGLAIHRDGRIFIAAIDIPGGKGAILSVRPDGSGLTTVIPDSAGFMPNDLVFDAAGGLYFSDFRGTATDPRGGIYYIAPGATTATATKTATATTTATATVVLPNIAMANGVALGPDGKTLWATEFGRNALYRVQLADATHPAPLGTALAYRFTGPAPDSMRIDRDGNLYVALYGQGRVLAFGRNGVPIGQILLPGRDEGHNLGTTNTAIRPGSTEMFIVTSDSTGQPARILRSRTFAPALMPFSHTGR